MNKVILIGNLTRDPEVKYLPSGANVTEFDLAVNRRFKGKDGSRQEETLFVSISAWGRTGELVAEYMKKGRKLLVEGRLKMDRWQDKNDGSNRSKISVVAEAIEFIDNNRDSGDYSGGGGGGSYNQSSGQEPSRNNPPSNYQQSSPPPSGSTEDDLPF